MSGRCRYGIALPDHGWCPACGAGPENDCRGEMGIAMKEHEGRMSGLYVSREHADAVRERKEWLATNDPHKPDGETP